ncbi:mechanosensitive ion channel family protein [Staphylococcus hominis]|uniref:mechanosensitive ion channel family protein n=1 Tax=Staphylococcus hominis TaxID=1290 RepID=UPI00066DDC41|nr:mechanosensitive ion channel family protein [Staphylococcus hominis]MCI2840279.1 mechanosensitive ion channel family protein [Staphylococcus hominis]MCI2842485.1 mechanosensitive ion channel family protein [Staphylococcus hominis]MCI2851357.1 mechanosensitive ion channel family protein [Staphylococcus hominis]MCI2858471.1 mechanosensitive ion channel family protein [Staphylococcus hominis]MCI2880080.1 mechanosensitive ion channel family protein [Staphylococcus hominis]
MSQMKQLFIKFIEPLTKIEFYQNLLANILIIVAYILLGMIVIAISRKVVTKFFKVNEKKKTRYKIKRSETLSTLVQNLISYVVWFIVLTSILSRFGISVSAILAGAGVVGLAVGFGAQTVVKDIITGFFVIFEGQFDVSDYVQINSSGVTIAEGTVQTIGLRSTRIQSDTGEVYTLPNGTISEIVNYSKTDVSPLIAIPISPNEDYDVIEKELKAFLPTLQDKYDMFVAAPDLLGLDSIDGNEMVIKLLAHVKPGMHFPGQRLLRKEIISYFNDVGIHTPKPTLVKLEDEEK